MTDDLMLREAALDWFVRVNDPDFDAWDDFTGWLEKDPANADAFHAIAHNQAEMLPLVDAAATAPTPTCPTRPPWAGSSPRRRTGSAASTG